MSITQLLTQDQVSFFKTFGFLVRKNVFTPDEVRAYSEEIGRRAADSARCVPFEPEKIGQGGRQHSMLGASTPFTTSLVEDERMVGAAEQMCGEIAWAESSGIQFVGDSVWHYDGGCFEASGVNNLIYTQPVRADSGALRIIPGSHLPAFHEMVASFDPLGPQWTRAAATPEQKQRALDDIGAIPCFVCDADPGDVVSFHLRVYHGSLGGGTDRRACTLAYHAQPQTPEQTELAILVSQHALKTRDNSSDPWNPSKGFPDEWQANPQNNPRRAFWIEQLHKFSQMETEQHGVRATAENGKWKMVPFDSVRKD